MKTLYLDCAMGAAGDMLTAALLELLPEPDAFVNRLNGVGIPGVQFVREPAVKCGITGTHMRVLVHGQQESAAPHVHAHSHEEEHVHSHAHEPFPSHSHEEEHTHSHVHEHSHPHSGMHEIRHLVEHLHVSEKVRADVLAVYALIAEAESHAHGVPVSEIHFHEVGTLDAVADITAVCLLMEQLAPERVVVSPVHVGSGQVRCAHGILPVPAPATAYILRQVPIYGGAVQGELCTPTGAALLKHFATEFGAMPVLRVAAIGYGMGQKDFPAANCVRALLGDTAEDTDTMLELSCNVDDMTAEEIAFATERLLQGGARDAYTISVGMKKSRPGTLIRVLCEPQQKQALVALLFAHTTTLGVREQPVRRYTLRRELEALETPYGPVRRKRASGYGVERSKYEYEDLARIAREQGLSLEAVRQLVAAQEELCGKS